MTKKSLAGILLGFTVFFVLAAAIISQGHIDTTKKTCSNASIPGIVRDVEMITADTRPTMNSLLTGNIVFR